MPAYTPVAGQHAIDEAVIGVRLVKVANDQSHQRALEVASRLAVEHQLPGRVSLDPIAVAVGRQTITPGFSTPQFAPGTLFQRVNLDGSVAAELLVEPGTVTYRTREYRRWSDVVAFIKGFIAPVLRELMRDEGVGISVVELRCVDKFRAQLGDGAPTLLALVKAESPYVAEALRDRKSMLHSHIGWFDDVSDAGRTLVNVNIDVIDDDSKRERVATIFQLLSRQFREAPAISADDVTRYEEFLLNEFDRLHALDKELLKHLLSDEIQEAIQLFTAGAG